MARKRWKNWSKRNVALVDARYHDAGNGWLRDVPGDSFQPKTANLPVLFLTARAGEVDQIVSLELGADDYVQKPVSPRVLIARVKSLLRRFDRTEKLPAAVSEEKIVSEGWK